MPLTSKKGRKLIWELVIPAGESPRLRMAGPPYCANTGTASVSNPSTRPKIKSPPAPQPLQAVPSRNSKSDAISVKLSSKGCIGRRVGRGLRQRCRGDLSDIEQLRRMLRHSAQRVAKHRLAK